MARKKKILLDNDGVDKREMGYYSTPSFISEYLTKEMLRLNPAGKYVLDPAVGKEELLEAFYVHGMQIDSLDIKKYIEYKYSNFREFNFIYFYAELVEKSFIVPINSKYDYIIANPPYNCHEVSYIKDNKKWLNDLFKVGAYNMYSMFLSAMIDIAKEGCLIGVIISDSFLTATVHAKLREQIFKECSIHQIILCPNDLFWSQKADVRTCMLILQKGIHYQQEVQIVNRPKDTEDLKDILLNRRYKSVNIKSLKLGCDKTINQILIDVDEDVVKLFNQYPLLEKCFKCVTCISTGNDSKYLSKDKREGYTIPFYKNPAKRKFLASADAYLIDDYLEESYKVKDFMVRNKSLLSKEGIACSSMGVSFSAVYLPANGVTGVNPTIFPPSSDINWLLSYLNSSLTTYLIRGVLIRSNMVTSGYVNKLPILDFTIEEKKSLGMIAEKARNGVITIESAIVEIDNIIFSKGLFSVATIEKIKEFVNNLEKKV